MSGMQIKVWSPEQGPRQVFFSIEVKLLYDIDSVKQQFAGRVVLTFQWMLSAAEKERWEKDKGVFTADWRPPQVDVANAVDVTVEEEQPLMVDLHGNILVAKCKQLLKGSFLEVMELQNFPFDNQEFKIKMVFPESDEVFQLHPSAERAQFVRMTQDTKLVPEFKFTDPVLELGHTVVNQLQADFRYAEVRQPTVVLHVKAKRVWRSYMNKIVITLSLVSLGVMFAFFIPHDELPDRLAHVTTLFLTAVAFQLVIASTLPQIDYMTIIDKYIVALNVYMMLVMSMMTGVFWCHKHECVGVEHLAVLDHNAMSLAFLLWCMDHSMLLILAALAFAGEERKLTSAGTLCRHLGEAPYTTSSRYVQLQGSSRVFFGNLRAYRTATKTKEDHTFWTGAWYSADLYGQHGVEYAFISIVCDEAAGLQMAARKITGDGNVPCGQISWRTTDGLPCVGGPAVPVEFNIRGNPADRNGFMWLPGASVAAVSVNQLYVCVAALGIAGSFHRQEPAVEESVQPPPPPPGRAPGLATPLLQDPAALDGDSADDYSSSE